MKVNKSTIPLGSLIEKYLPTDYSDVYACEVNFEKEIIPDDLMVNFWTDFPSWINGLFKLRNFLVKIAGLKTTYDDKEFEKCLRTGKTFDFISFPAKRDNETVLLLSDKHLNAYISIHVESGKKHTTISAITLVHYHNLLGRVYFFIIRPFHGLIVKTMLKRALSTRYCISKASVSMGKKSKD
jgi:hypothetical protein